MRKKTNLDKNKLYDIFPTMKMPNISNVRQPNIRQTAPTLLMSELIQGIDSNGNPVKEFKPNKLYDEQEWFDIGEPVGFPTELEFIYPGKRKTKLQIKGENE